jgi:aspartate ammonia-lyase
VLLNTNQVIDNRGRGLKILSHAKGQYECLHPNDLVNSSEPINIATQATKAGGNVYGPVPEKGQIAPKQPNKMLKSENMTNLRQIPEA